MAIEINGKIYRNIQEQVAKNQEDIDDLNHRIPAEPHFYTKEETDELLATRYTKEETDNLLATKQNTLISSGESQNIKTINGDSILGAGNINIFDLIYPVGSIYMSVISTSPESLFGGTWEQLKDKFLLGAGDTYSNGATGGSSNHNHTLGNGYAKYNIKTTGDAYADSIEVDNWQPNYACHDADVFSEFESWTIDNAIKLGGTTDNASSLPPYLVVYIWKRTA